MDEHPFATYFDVRQGKPLCFESHPFLVGRVPHTKIDYRKKGTVILASLLEDLD